MESDQNYLTNILSPLLEYPDALVIDRSVDERGTLLMVAVAREDMGRIIGREGKTANAIRHLINSFGLRAGSKVSVKINEPTA